MTGALDTRACEPCAKSKRGCGKQVPRCMRCTQRGIECVYPPPRPLSFVVFTDNVESPSIEHESATQLPAYPSTPYSIASSDNVPYRGTRQNGIPSSNFNGPDSSLDTWGVTFAQSEAGPSYILDVQRHIARVRDWLFQWIEQGSNEFIHSHLYQAHFPECAQDAYMATSMYMHRNNANRHIVLRIIECQAKKLVVHHTVDAADSLPPSTVDAEVSCNTAKNPIEHLARVQALLAYQIIGLFDGDIRLRHVSESHIHVLNTWMQAMLKHISRSSNLGGSATPSSQGQIPGAPGFGSTAYNTDEENLEWHSWILTESIRRTWSIASGVQVGYLVIREGQPAMPCMGGMMFTSRLGVWEAQSAADWARIAWKGDFGLVQMAQADRLFTEASPKEVNDFTKMCLALTFGYERTKKWESIDR